MSHPFDPLAAIVDDIASRVAERVLAELRRNHGSQPKPTDQAPRYLRERAAGERLGLSVRTLQGWRSAGLGPRFVKFGKRVAYPLDDLQQWIESGSSKRANDAGGSAVRTNRPERRVATQEVNREV